MKLPPLVISTCKKYSDVLNITLRRLINLSEKENIKLEIHLISDQINIPENIKDLEKYIKKIHYFDSDCWNLVVYKCIQNLINSGYKTAILLLDDFWISRVNFKELYSICDIFTKNELDYLSLDPEDKNIFFNRELRAPMLRNKIPNCYQINPDYCYTCSLKASIWDLKYLALKAKDAKNIWDFEKQAGSPLSYATLKKPLKYFHVVEKGKLVYRTIFINSFRILKRPYISFIGWLINLRRTLRYKIFSCLNLENATEDIYILNGDLEDNIATPFHFSLFKLRSLYKFLNLRYKYKINYLLDFTNFFSKPLFNFARFLFLPYFCFINGINIKRIKIIIFKNQLSKSNNRLLIFSRRNYVLTPFLKNFNGEIIYHLDHLHFWTDKKIRFLNYFLQNNKNLKMVSQPMFETDFIKKFFASLCKKTSDIQRNTVSFYISPRFFSYRKIKREGLAITGTFHELNSSNIPSEWSKFYTFTNLTTLHPERLYLEKNDFEKIDWINLLVDKYHPTKVKNQKKYFKNDISFLYHSSSSALITCEASGFIPIQLFEAMASGCILIGDSKFLSSMGLIENIHFYHFSFYNFSLSKLHKLVLLCNRKVYEKAETQKSWIKDFCNRNLNI